MRYAWKLCLDNVVLRQKRGDQSYCFDSVSKWLVLNDEKRWRVVSVVTAAVHHVGSAVAPILFGLFSLKQEKSWGVGGVDGEGVGRPNHRRRWADIDPKTHLWGINLFAECRRRRRELQNWNKNPSLSFFSKDAHVSRRRVIYTSEIVLLISCPVLRDEAPHWNQLSWSKYLKTKQKTVPVKVTSVNGRYAGLLRKLLFENHPKWICQWPSWWLWTHCSPSFSRRIDQNSGHMVVITQEPILPSLTPQTQQTSHFHLVSAWNVRLLTRKTWPLCPLSWLFCRFVMFYLMVGVLGSGSSTLSALSC